jgi:glyoxylase-like metal-dependent hydrolase (beta-lactamase superfamily II)
VTLAAHPEIVRISLPTPFPVGQVNVFLVKDEIPLLIDAGCQAPHAYERLVSRLQENGLRVGDIGRVLLTHGHLDHAGLLARIVKDSGAEAYAHPYVIEQYRSYKEGIEDSERFLAGVMRRFGMPEEGIQRVWEARSGYASLADQVEIQHAVRDGESAAGFTVHYVPGHSATDVLYYDPRRRIVFSGDHLLRGVSPNPLIRKPREAETRPKSLVEYQQSLRRTYDLDIDLCYPGHGEPFPNHRLVINGLLERHERRTRNTLALLGSHVLTPYQLMRLLFPKIDVRMAHLGLSVAIGHLEVLEERNEVVAEERDGVLYYRRRP